jgi:hypothetical protein
MTHRSVSTRHLYTRHTICVLLLIAVTGLLLTLFHSVVEGAKFQSVCNVVVSEAKISETLSSPFGVGVRNLSRYVQECCSVLNSGVELKNCIRGIHPPHVLSLRSYSWPAIPLIISHVGIKGSQLMWSRCGVSGDSFHGIEGAPSDYGVGSDIDRDKRGQYQPSFCNWTSRTPRIPPLLSFGLGFAILFYGYLNLLIYVVFNEGVRRFWMGLSFAGIGTWLLWHGAALL